MIRFDGTLAASKKEVFLVQEVASLLDREKKVSIGAVLFREDAGSQLYTRLKGEAASRVGIAYFPFEFSIQDSVEKIAERLSSLNFDPTITGIIIQKPTKKTWQAAQVNDGVGEERGQAQAYAAWWKALTSRIDQKKDVDGLSPGTLVAVAEGNWKEQGRVLPATCQAVLEILQQVPPRLSAGKILIVGKSDLLGTPLYHVLRHEGKAVELLTKVDLEQRKVSGQNLLDAAVVVSATGVPGLITGAMVREGVVVIDVGEPKPDIDVPSVQEKATFLTPVPGGVGPMTVVCLLENAVKLTV